MITATEQRGAKVKICGLTNFEDALLAIEAGADALGFNGWPGSKRFVDLARAAAWVADLPVFVQRIAVLVNPAMEDIDKLAALRVFDGVQLHGDETPAFCTEAARRFPHVIKAVRAAGWEDVATVVRFGTRNVLVDAAVPAGTYGGAGRLTDWAAVKRLVEAEPGLRVILSGGLNPDNIREAVSLVKPYAVDVASGVEAAGDPRRKDAAAMSAFCAAAR